MCCECKYELRKGDLVVLELDTVRRVRRGSISLDLRSYEVIAQYILNTCYPARDIKVFIPNLEWLANYKLFNIIAGFT